MIAIYAITGLILLGWLIYNQTQLPEEYLENDHEAWGFNQFNTKE